MSAGFSFTACCPRCGGELLTDNQPASVDAPDESHHDARCDRCLYLWRIAATATLLEAWHVDRLDPEARRAEACAEAARVLHVGSVG